MYDLKNLSAKKGFYWLVFTELLLIAAAISQLLDGKFDVAALIFILIEIRSYIFTKVSIDP